MYIVSIFHPSVAVCEDGPRSLRTLLTDARMGKLYSSEGFKKQCLVSDTIMSVVNEHKTAKGKEACIRLLDELGESEDFRIIEMHNWDYGLDVKIEFEVSYLACFNIYHR